MRYSQSHMTLALFLTLIFIVLLAEASFAENGIKDNMARVTGKGCFTFGDNDSPASAKERALLIAKRNAVEYYKSFVSSSTRIKNIELEKDLMDTLAEGYLYSTKILGEREEGREVCIEIEAFVKPDEIEKLLSEKNGAPAEEKENYDLLMLSGEWKAYSQEPATSLVEWSDPQSALWRYSVPKVSEETYAVLNLNILPMDILGRKVEIRLESKKGASIFIRFYSYAPGFSKIGKDATYVPVEWQLHVKKGSQEFLLDPSKLPVPGWWLEKQLASEASFNPKDVRIIELEADVDEETAPVSDIVEIKSITLH